MFSLRVLPQYSSPLVVKVTITRQGGGNEGAPLKADVYYWSTQEFDMFEKLYHPGTDGGGGRDEEAELEEILEDYEEVTLPYLIRHDLQCEGWIRDALLVREHRVTVFAKLLCDYMFVLSVYSCLLSCSIPLFPFSYNIVWCLLMG